MGIYIVWYIIFAKHKEGIINDENVSYGCDFRRFLLQFLFGCYSLNVRPCNVCMHLNFLMTYDTIYALYVWLNGLVVSALGIRAQGPGFDSRVAPLFHWASCSLTLPPQFRSSKKLGYKREFLAPKWLW